MVTDRDLDRAGWIKRMPKFEKIFWASILVFFLIYVGLNVAAYVNQLAPDSDKHESILGDYVESYFVTDKVHSNLENNKSVLEQNLNEELKYMYKAIDNELDSLFLPVENNIDAFLDFHYSVIGEYVELGSMAAGKIEAVIEEKLFGPEFISKLTVVSNNINNNFTLSVDNHLSKINEIALYDIDENFNKKELQRLEKDIHRNKVTQVKKVGLLAAIRFGPMVVSKVSVKLANKAIIKVSTKSAAKLATKSTAAAGAAALGAFCGPLVWVCSPVAAVIVWVATDIVIVTSDEYINREDFKNEILLSITENKEVLSQQYKDMYFQSYTELSSNIQEAYKDIELKEKKRIKVKDKFE